MRLQIALLTGVLLACGVMGWAEPIRSATASAEITVEIAQWVAIDFPDCHGFFIDVEAGQVGAAAQKKFIARSNCSARVTVQVIPPPCLPAGVSFAWKLTGACDNREIVLDGCQDHVGHVEVAVSGVSMDTPAGLYPGGLLRIMIAAQ